jgi:hypothetical protein
VSRRSARTSFRLRGAQSNDNSSRQTPQRYLSLSIPQSACGPQSMQFRSVAGNYGYRRKHAKEVERPPTDIRAFRQALSIDLDDQALQPTGQLGPIAGGDIGEHASPLFTEEKTLRRVGIRPWILRKRRPKRPRSRLGESEPITYMPVKPRRAADPKHLASHFRSTLATPKEQNV